MMLLSSDGWLRSILQNEAGDADGSSGPADATPDTSQSTLQSKIDEATAGLKRTNVELKNEKTAIKKQLESLSAQFEQLGGSDGIETLLKLKQSFEADETNRLLAEGKHDEWFNTRARSLQTEYENQLAERDRALEEAMTKAGDAESRLHSVLLDREVADAATRSGVRPSAIEDVRLRASQYFTFDDQLEQLVQRDAEGNVVPGKDGSQAKSVSEWLQEQSETSRHWWPPSRSGGASGSGAGSSGSATRYSDDPREYQRQRRAEREQQRR